MEKYHLDQEHAVQISNSTTCSCLFLYFATLSLTLYRDLLATTLDVVASFPLSHFHFQLPGGVGL